VKLVVARYCWISLIGGLLSKRRLGLASQTTWDLFDNHGERSLQFGMNGFTSDDLCNTLRLPGFKHSLVMEASLQTEIEDVQETLEEQSTSNGD
jgi:hypothetical protein